MFLTAPSMAQDNWSYPKIGEKCPDFTLDDVKYHSSDKLSLGDLKGKYVILDFWAVWCTTCVHGFPKMNQLQKKYSDKLKIVLIGRKEAQRDVKAFYKKARESYGLELVSAFDSSLTKRFVPGIIPHLIFIDNKGVIRAITSGITEAAVDNFVNDKSFGFIDRSYHGNIASAGNFNSVAPRPWGDEDMLEQGDNYIFKSMVSKWKIGMGSPMFDNISSYIQRNHGSYKAIGTSLSQLYTLAYFGTLDVRQVHSDAYPYPLVKVQDSSKFVYDQQTGVGLYNFSVALPPQKGKETAVMEVLQGCLRQVFGYSAKVADDKVPCLRLIVTDKKRTADLKNVSGPRIIRWYKESEDNMFKNVDINEIMLFFSYELSKSELAFNETGITGKISLTISGDIEDLDNVRKELRKQGLDLIPSFVKLQRLQISD